MAVFLSREIIYSRREWECSHCITDCITLLNGGGERANCSTQPFVIVFSTHGDTAHARQLSAQPGRLCSELNLSGTTPLMVNESKPRSTPTPPREGDEIWGCPLMFSKKMWGRDCTVCIAGGVAQACLGTAPSGTGVRTYDCGACENLLTVLDMISACERRADFCVATGLLSPFGVVWVCFGVVVGVCVGVW